MDYITVNVYTYNIYISDGLDISKCRHFYPNICNDK